MILDNFNLNHPIVFGIIAALITYVIVRLDVNLENN